MEDLMSDVLVLQADGTYKRFKDMQDGTHAEIVAVGTSTGAVSVKDAAYVPLGDQQMTIDTLQTVQGLTVPAGATRAWLQNNSTQAMRWRDNGQNPQMLRGQRIYAGDTLEYSGNLSAIRVIAEATGTGHLDIWYGA
jgi:hypothetical protein